jgi:hypothetical protein
LSENATPSPKEPLPLAIYNKLRLFVDAGLILRETPVSKLDIWPWTFMSNRLVTWVLALFILLHGCDTESPTKRITEEEKTRQERQAQDKAKRDEIIGALKKSHGADDSWQEGVKMNTWTVDLQDRIVGKSIVASGFLVDVWLGKDGKHHLRFLDEPFLGPRYDFVLTCSKREQSFPNARSFPEYFFAARVHSVQKDARIGRQDLITGYSKDGPRFTIFGECLEVRLSDVWVHREQRNSDLREIRKKLRSIPPN